MKNIQFTITFLILFTACDFKKNSPLDQQGLKIENTSLSQKDIDKEIRAEINSLYLEELSKCSQNFNAVTDFNGRTEFWKICETESKTRIIQINSHEESNLFSEVYFEKNGVLIYAQESINYTPINHFVLKPWTCDFYAEKGKLISILSLGHGKTENEDWDPEIIFEMHENRILELNSIAKE